MKKKKRASPNKVKQGLSAIGGAVVVYVFMEGLDSLVRQYSLYCRERMYIPEPEVEEDIVEEEIPLPVAVGYRRKLNI